MGLLTSVTAFENITSVGGDLFFRGNISLSQCTIDDLVDDWQERGVLRGEAQVSTTNLECH